MLNNKPESAVNPNSMLLVKYTPTQTAAHPTFSPTHEQIDRDYSIESGHEQFLFTSCYAEKKLTRSLRSLVCFVMHHNK